jgi:hypothetical protein
LGVAIAMNLAIISLAMSLLLGQPRPSQAPARGDPLQEAERLAMFLSGRDSGHKLVMIEASTLPEYDDAAARLIEIGEPGLPAVEREIEALEQGQAKPSDAMERLLVAFASVKRQDSYGRLERMLLNPRLKDFHRQITRAVAVALRLTSYHAADESLPILPVSPYGRLPQEALGQFLVSWTQGDMISLSDVIGDRSNDPLPELRALRETLGRGASPRPGSGIGYRFASPGPIWGYEIPRRGEAVPYVSRYDTDVELFVGDKPCGTVHLQFMNMSYSSTTMVLHFRFVVAGEDLGSVVRSVGACAGSPLWKEPPPATR